MSANLVEAYLVALRKRQQAVERMERLVGSVKQVVSRLGSWKRVIISNVGGGYPALSRTPHESINPDEWPSISDVHNRLTEYHQADFETKAAWSLVPPELRAGLTAPS